MKRTILALVILIAVTVGLRVANCYDSVITDHGVIYQGVDPWYYMRQADYAVENGGSMLLHDNYDAFPDGKPVGNRPMLVWLIAIPGMILDHEVVGAWMPVIIGAATVLAVYVLGMSLFQRKFVAFGGALLVAVMPTEYFNRTMFGFPDHHGLEVLFTVLTLLFLHKAVTQKWYWGIAAGISHGLLYLSWHGAGLLLAVIVVAFTGIIVYRKIKAQDITHWRYAYFYYAVVLFVIFVLMIDVANVRKLDAVEIICSVTLCIAFLAIGKMPAGKKGVVITCAVALAGVILLVVFRNNPLMVQAVREFKSVVWGFGSTIMEAKPSTPLQAFNEFGILLVLAPFGLYYAIANKKDAVFIIWSICMFIAAIGQRRWGYYTVVPMALYSCYAISLFGDVVLSKARTSLYIACMVGIISVSGHTIIATSHTAPYLSPGMYNACTWLRENTAEPFGTPDAYYNSNIDGGYGVLSWWDYGHWIIRIGRRPVLSSPTWQDIDLHDYLVAQTPEKAEAVIGDTNVRYVMITREMLESKFIPITMRLEEGMPEEDIRQYHDKTMAARLWNGEIKEVYTLVYGDNEVRIYERSINAD